MPQITTTPETAAHWVYIERAHSRDLLVGPYPTQDHAQIAMEEALLIEGFAQEDATDISLTYDRAANLAGDADVVLIDTDDEHHTGKVPRLTMPDAPTITITLTLDNAQQDALRSLLADAHQARLDAGYEMDEQRALGAAAAYDREDGVRFHERNERDWALTETLLAAVDAGVAEERTRALPLDAETPGAEEHEHQWVLIEEGYTRRWGTEVDHEEKQIAATDNGSDDFTYEGSGEFLTCEFCGTVRDVPEEWEVDYL